MVTRTTRATRSKRGRAVPFPRTEVAMGAWMRDQFKKGQERTRKDKKGQERTRKARSAGVARPRATKRKNWACSFRPLAAF